LRVLVCLAAAALGAIGWVCIVQPSPSAAQTATTIKSSNPLSNAPEAIAAGERLYAKFCLQCHGANGDGVSPRWGRIGADLRKFWRGYTEFVNIVAAGRPEKRMPPWGSVLDADQINQIGAYLETLASPGAKWTD
jgi:mono/diheme cytochrome c family protein